MNLVYRLSTVALLILFCGLIYFPFIGEVNLFDWDETLVASVSKEMFINNSYLRPLLNHELYLEKPPLFHWMQCFSYNYLGIKEYASRIPNAICGLLVVLTLFKMGRRLFSKSFGITWAIIYLSLFLPQLYHKTGLYEPWFNFFIFLSLYNMTRIIEMRQERGDGFYKRSDLSKSLFWSAFACVGALMVKGIEAYFIIILCYWGVFIASSAKYGLGYFNIFKWTLLVFAIISIWVFVEYRTHGTDYLVAFYNYQLTDINIERVSWTKKISFHFIILLIGCFPASIIAFNTLRPKTYESNIQQIFRLMMVSCLIVVFLIATFIKHKVVHYSSLAYLPISFLAAYNIRYIYEESKKVKPIIIAFITIVGLFWAFLLTIVPYTRANIDFLKKYIDSPLLQTSLSFSYQWQEYEQYIGILFLILLLISILLLLFKKTNQGVILLFFSTMFFSQIILIYYSPKIEQLTQGPEIDFIKNKATEKAFIYHHNSLNYAVNFYSDSLIPYRENLFNKDSLKKYSKSKIPFYILRSNIDTSNEYLFKTKCKLMYSQGLYSFYKLNKTGVKVKK